MAVFTIASFTTFAGLLLAARKLATDPDPLNRFKALADLARDGRALAAILTATDLAPLARKMAADAEAVGAVFTHAGPGRDDAVALFWQVAPAAFSDPAAFARADLEPEATIEAMLAAIKADPAGRDFTRNDLAVRYFRLVAAKCLTTMLGDATYLASITPALWRETLARHGVTLELLQAVSDDTAEILALVRELHRTKETTVPEDTLIAMARKISPRIADREEALRELDNAADIAASLFARSGTGANLDAFVDDILARLAALTTEGRLDEAARAAEAAADQVEAGLISLVSGAVDQHRLAFDASGAARQVLRRVALETPSPTGTFTALLREQGTWYESGRDKGLRLDLEISIALARHVLNAARNADERGAAQNNLGTVLTTLGERDGASERFHEAVEAYRAALLDFTRNRVPLDWAATQNNLGAALQNLGERDGAPEQLHEAVEAYRAALLERTRNRVPLDWAMTQNNLGTALTTLGQREAALERLHEAVEACRAALLEFTRDRAPFEWATTQSNLGNVLTILGEREAAPDRLHEAVEAYRAALTERTRERVPLDWAKTSGNEGVALVSLAGLTSDLGGARQALDKIAVAAAVMRDAGHEPNAAYFESQRCAAEALVARLGGA